MPEQAKGGRWKGFVFGFAYATSCLFFFSFSTSEAFPLQTFARPGVEVSSHAHGAYDWLVVRMDDDPNMEREGICMERGKHQNWRSGLLFSQLGCSLCIVGPTM